MNSTTVRSWIAFCAVVALGLSCGAGSAFPAAPAFEDKNGYFSLIPPHGWKTEEGQWAYRSEVKFTSPDNDASIVILAELDGDNLNSLLVLKKRFIRDHLLRFPQHKFQLTRTTLAGFDALKIGYEIPGSLKEDLYYFYYDGVRYDLVYWGNGSVAYQEHQEAASEALFSIRPKPRLLLYQ